jgi:cytochrome P450
MVPKGTEVVIVPSVAHFNKSIWGPTAEEFDPDRWENLPDTARDPYAFLSFIAGPRVCIGKHFAILEIIAILVELVRNFKFEATSPNIEFQRHLVTLRPEGGLQLRVKPLE